MRIPYHSHRFSPTIRHVEDVFLTASQVAERLGLTRQTVYALVERGALRATRLGTGPKAHLRIRQADYDAFVGGARDHAAELADIHDRYLQNRARSLLAVDGKSEDDATADELLAAYSQATAELAARLIGATAVPSAPRTSLDVVDVHKRALKILEAKGITAPSQADYLSAATEASDELGPVT
jgi:excisionase family DNA binding protein